MIQQPLLQWCLAMAMSTSLLLGGCTSTLVHDDVKYPKTGAHCSGSEGVDDSSIAVLPSGRLRCSLRESSRDQGR
jgi:hypothetical protein